MKQLICVVFLLVLWTAPSASAQQSGPSRVTITATRTIKVRNPDPMSSLASSNGQLAFGDECQARVGTSFDKVIGAGPRTLARIGMILPGPLPQGPVPCVLGTLTFFPSPEWDQLQQQTNLEIEKSEVVRLLKLADEMKTSALPRPPQ